MTPSARLIVELNIRHFRALLETDMDSAKRETIERLLKEQERMLHVLERKDAG
ncbi:MAG TPA: hypothetical protein VE224_05245 [Pseudolabrys sp.]|nr:hypothetical protein [Pseudolabrys sp.]